MKRDALGELLRFEPPFVAEAKADRFWQILALTYCGVRNHTPSR